MCGITGFWDTRQRFGSGESDFVVRNMTSAIRHRGPDDVGVFRDDTGVSLGHRRLSIVDLSPEGHQPMSSVGGRYVMVYNGEVYNHDVLRQELVAAGVRFRGHSDTEVMLAAIEHYGLEVAVKRFIGMFAFALWDQHEQVLTLVRDRLGIKPLYYGWVGSLFVFGSELKAIKAVPGFTNPVNRDALVLLLRYNYIPAPYSIYSSIYKLMPGTMLRVDRQLAGTPTDVIASMRKADTYWSAREVAEAGVFGRSNLSDAEAVTELDYLLRDAVKLRMHADVPLGAFLSGGVDSSTVVALMQAQSSRRVQTFSIGFESSDFDEAEHARSVAKHLGTDHHELYVSAKDALDVVPQLHTMFDEPFADASQIPTYLVSKLARGMVTVSLSGDGGDELFAGYNRYFWGGTLRRYLDQVPLSLRRSLARALGHGDWFGHALAQVSPYLPTRLQLQDPKGKASKLVDVLGAANDDERYRLLVSQWPDPTSIVVDGRELLIGGGASGLDLPLCDPVERMMYSDLVSYLPDDILTKVDRASMAVSLEARVPLLDHRVVEFAWKIPMRQKVRDGQGKWLLRQVLYQYVPKNLIERPKQGFGGPVHQWLRGPLRDWAESQLSVDRLRREGYFNVEKVRKVWEDHLAGRVDASHRLWGVLMFQAWLAQSEHQ